MKFHRTYLDSYSYNYPDGKAMYTIWKHEGKFHLFFEAGEKKEPVEVASLAHCKEMAKMHFNAFVMPAIEEALSKRLTL